MNVIRIYNSMRIAQRRIRASLGVLLGCALCSGLLCGPVSKPICRDMEFYYHDNLQERLLTLDTTHIWISAPQGVSDEALSLLTQAGIQPAGLELLGETGTYLAPVPAERADTCGVRDLVGDLGGGDTFDFVSPVFVDRAEFKVLHRLVFVTFDLDVGRDEAQQILIDAGTNGLATNGLASGAQLVSTITRNGFEVLEIANRLAQHPRVYAAQPYIINPQPGLD